jgi:zinc transporter, ZIP family
MLEATAWGLLAASSLLIGASLGVGLSTPPRLVGLILGFGAGALISAVSFDLAQEGLDVDPVGTGAGLALGALTYFWLDRLIDRHAARDGGGGSSSGRSLALGAFLDGVPEQLVLGIGIATGEGVSVALLIAIFVSNLPEAIGSASEMTGAGNPRGRTVWLWVGVTAICALATAIGFLLGDLTTGGLRAGIDGFAAGALLVMLIDTMIPNAREQAGRVTGLVTVLGFALAAGLSNLT